MKLSPRLRRLRNELAGYVVMTLVWLFFAAVFLGWIHGIDRWAIWL